MKEKRPSNKDLRAIFRKVAEEIERDPLEPPLVSPENRFITLCEEAGFTEPSSDEKANRLYRGWCLDRRLLDTLTEEQTCLFQESAIDIHEIICLFQDVITDLQDKLGDKHGL